MKFFNPGPAPVNRSVTYQNAPNPSTDTGWQAPAPQQPVAQPATQMPKTNNPQLTSAMPTPQPPQQPAPQPQAPQVVVAPVVQSPTPVMATEAPVTTTSVAPQNPLQVQKGLLEMALSGAPMNASHISQAIAAGAPPAFIDAVKRYAVGLGWSYQEPQAPVTMVNKTVMDTPAPVTTTTVQPPPRPVYPLNAAQQQYQNWQNWQGPAQQGITAISDPEETRAQAIGYNPLAPVSVGSPSDPETAARLAAVAAGRQGLMREPSHTGSTPHAAPPGAGTGYGADMEARLLAARRQAQMRQRPVNTKTSIYTGIAR